MIGYKKLHTRKIYWFSTDKRSRPHGRKTILSLLICLLFIGNSTRTTGQTYNEKIEELEEKLGHSSTIEDTTKVDLLNDLSYAYRRNNPSKIDSFARLALDLSKRIEYDKGRGIAYKNLGIAVYKLNKPIDTSIVYYDKALFWAKKAEDYYTQVACLNNLGLTYGAQFAFDKSIKVYLEAIDIHTTHLTLDRLRLLLEANIGQNYLILADYQNAKKHFDKLFELAKRQDNQAIIAMYINEYARLQHNLNKTDVALDMIMKYLPIIEDLGDYQSLVRTQVVLSSILIERNELAEAYETLIEANNTIQTYNLKVEQCEIQLNLSKIFWMQGAITKAKSYGLKSLDCTAESPISKLRLSIIKNLINIYLSTNEADKAAELFPIYNELQQEYFDLQKQTAHVQADLEHEVKDKEAENALLKSRQNEDEATIRAQRIFTSSLAIITLLAFILGFLGIRAYRLKQRQNELLDQKVLERTQNLDDSNKALEKSNKNLEKSNKELERFVYIASHDLKQPLSNIINFSNLLEMNIDNVDTRHNKIFIDKVIGESHQMMTLIEDVLEFSTLESNLKMEAIDLNLLVDEIDNSMASNSKNKSSTIAILDTLPIIKYNRQKIVLVFKNLIENGIKYNRSEQPMIKIRCVENQEFLTISFEDNGIGIQKEFFPKIFKMFSRLETRKEFDGSGLGLSICEKIIENMGGMIDLDSEYGKGSTFYLHLPINFKDTSFVAAAQLSAVLH